jgi:hypothetical protein
MIDTETYEIRVRGRLDDRWATWFDDMDVITDDGDTVIRGQVVDQAALHGLIQRVRDLGLPLISVTNSSTNSSTGPSAGPSAGPSSGTDTGATS